MPDKFPTHSMLEGTFDSFEQFLQSLADTSFVTNAPPQAAHDLLKAVHSYIGTLKQEFPDGMSSDPSTKNILTTLDARLEPFVLAMAGRSWLTILSLYANASDGRRALADCVGTITEAMIECFPPKVAMADPVKRAFVEKVYAATQKLKEQLRFPDEEECDCPVCQSDLNPHKKKAPQKAKVEVKPFDEDDPETPQCIKDVVEYIKEHGKPPELGEAKAFAIDYTKPETWDEALAALPFPPGVKPKLLKELRAQYHKHTGKYAPGDPAISNN